MDGERLTPMQRDIMLFLQGFLAGTELRLTNKTVADEFGFTRANAAYHLGRLDKMGRIKVTGKPRIGLDVTILIPVEEPPKNDGKVAAP